LPKETFRRTPQPSHHAQHAVGFHPAAELGPRQGGRANSADLLRDLAPRHSARTPLLIHGFKQGSSVKSHWHKPKLSCPFFEVKRLFQRGEIAIVRGRPNLHFNFNFTQKPTYPFDALVHIASSFTSH
jgi:hypothetical protein